MEKKFYPAIPIDPLVPKYGVIAVDTDPFGSYTGVPKMDDELPVQDADDL